MGGGLAGRMFVIPVIEVGAVDSDRWRVFVLLKT